ncbi:MAG: RdgB/HAM1 family non-canonical purine NTP pyrophosphatase [Gemmatimonadota bacterium]|jgi:non-canonical purine NTP pyrophosphatase (RdgB/HAM1 family)
MSETLLVATRNAHKLDEIRDLLRGTDTNVLSLVEVGLAPHPGEDSVETHDTFFGNALAKARYYRKLTGQATIADDSGLCVDALNGVPGVHSRRFAPPEFRRNRTEDEANNAWLLDRLEGVAAESRSAHYRCVLALVDYRRTLLVQGVVHGRIAERESGRNGFGYDPLFVPEAETLTFGELPPEIKAARSHRADAIRRLRPWLS